PPHLPRPADHHRRGDRRGLHLAAVAHLSRVVLAALEYLGGHRPDHTEVADSADLLGWRKIPRRRGSGRRFLRRRTRGVQLVYLEVRGDFQRWILLPVADAVRE